MESMQMYWSPDLDADYYRQEAQNDHKKMAMDPRTRRPFRDENMLAPVSGKSLTMVRGSTSLIPRPIPSFLMLHAEKWEGLVSEVT